MAVLIGYFGAIVLYQEWPEAEAAAAQEAEEIGAVFALLVSHLAENTGARAWDHHFQKDLQNTVLRFHALHQRNMFVVDRHKKILAGHESAEIGIVFRHDPHGEVSKTLEDGVARSFIEVNNEYQHGARHLVTRVVMPDGEPLALLLNYEDLWWQLFLSSQREMRQLAALTTTCILLALLMGYAVQRGVASPLLELQRAMASFAWESDSGVLPPTSIPELHQLFITFTAMANQLADSHAQLMRQQEHLAHANASLITMPKMKGIEFLKIAKQEEPLKRIPVVVLTTSKADQSRPRAV